MNIGTGKHAHRFQWERTNGVVGDAQFARRSRKLYQQFKYYIAGSLEAIRTKIGFHGTHFD